VFILQGDYDLVITDYTRTKSLFWVTEVQAFKKGKMLQADWSKNFSTRIICHHSVTTGSRRYLFHAADVGERIHIR
jgi:hypothetical protein